MALSSKINKLKLNTYNTIPLHYNICICWFFNFEIHIGIMYFVNKFHLFINWYSEQNRNLVQQSKCYNIDYCLGQSKIKFLYHLVHPFISYHNTFREGKQEFTEINLFFCSIFYQFLIFAGPKRIYTTLLNPWLIFQI